VLIALSRLLTDGTRVGDIVARLGGDEFAMLLEETDEDAAAGKARDLLDRSAALRSYSGSPDHPLGISISIAVTDPRSGEGLKALIARADSAMYRVKRGQKGSFAFAQAVTNEDGG
jgi:diguanylate cyclase (GGDEF)-like protein